MKNPNVIRTTLALVFIAILTVIAAGYLIYAKQTGQNPGVMNAVLDITGIPFSLKGSHKLLFVDKTPGVHFGKLASASVDRPVETREYSNYECNRVYIAGNHVLCLRSRIDVILRFEAVILNDQLQETRIIQIAGMPSRARISQDGRIASWTVFVNGDSYLSSGFSTRTSIFDLNTGELVGNLESFAVIKDGELYQAADINFWGVTVADDDDTFFATMASNKQTFLVKGSIRKHSVQTLKQNVECPSLSPDGTRVAFKKRVLAEGENQPWRLYVLDLTNLVETPLAETHSVDDQAVWLNNQTIAYSLGRPGTSVYDVWSVQSDGTGHPNLLLELAASPAPVLGHLPELTNLFPDSDKKNTGQ